MLSLFKIFVKTYVLTLFCIIALSAINLQDNSVINQNAPNTKVVADTLIINKLFKQGYQFIDGPSDSLLFYFGKALVIIQNNLDEINTTQPSNFELINIYQNLKTRTFIEFGIEYFYQNNYKQALNYFNEALEIARLTDNKDLISECVNEIGIVFKNQGNYDRALIFYNEALDLAKLSTDTSWIASCQINIGNVYKEKGFLNIAQKYFLEALKIMESLGQKRRIAACYQNIGDIYHQQRDYQKALEYFTKSLNLAKNTNDKVRELTVYLNIGAVYLQTKQYQTARIFLEKALFLYDETGYQHEKDNCYLLLGKSWFYENDFELAISSYEKALHISKIKQDKSSIAEIEGNLAKVYFQLKNYNKALELYKSSLEAAQSIGLLELKIEVSSNLSQLYEVLGQPNLAFQFYKNFSQLKDSLFNAEKYKAIKEMEVKYESEKKQQQLDLLSEKNEIQQLKLSRRNRLMFALIAGIVLLILIGYLLRSQSILKSRQKEIELEQRLLRSQMNPHFIFNSLIAIQSYIYKKDPIIAGDYLARFAELVRLILENSRVEFVSLKKEVEAIKVYLELQELRFENKFDYTLQVPEHLNPENTMVPPMFAQPFIENAIEHGLRHKTTKGHLEITYVINNKSCAEISIRDNGIGRDKAAETEKKKEHQSLALNITKDRLRVLSKKYKYEFTLELTDLTNNKNDEPGTKVNILIPYKMS